MEKGICKKGLTLIEMLVVIMIIGILAAVAIPMYMEQITKAKLAEVTNAVCYVVTTLNQYHHNDVLNGGGSAWPDCQSIAVLQTSLGVPLGAIGRISAALVHRNTGTVSVTVTNINSRVNGSAITFTPSINASGASISWKWGGPYRRNFFQGSNSFLLSTI